MYCRKCGRRLPANLSHCPSCGTELSGATQPQQNPANQQPNSDQYRTAPVQNMNQSPRPYPEPARDSFRQPTANTAPSPAHVAPPLASAASPQTNAAPAQDPPQPQAGGTGSWSVGAKIWFALVILGLWAVFIFALVICLPEMQMHPDWQWQFFAQGIADAVMTALYAWVYVSKTKNALHVLLCIAAIAALKALVDGDITTAVSDITAPAITWLIARKVVS